MLLACAACATEFKPKYNSNKARFCSLPCSYKGINAERSEKKRKAYEADPVLCEVCQSPLTWDQRKTGNRFCSHGCARTKTNKANSRYRAPRYICAGCLVSFQSKSFKKATYCSIKCQSRHRFLTITVPNVEQGLVASSPALKAYLIHKNGEVCQICKQLPIHARRFLRLQIDHIDGNSDNNLPENLRLLCPNCHTQTHTYCRGNPLSRRNQLRRDWRQKKAGGEDRTRISGLADQHTDRCVTPALVEVQGLEPWSPACKTGRLAADIHPQTHERPLKGSLRGAFR
jgi:hypothetical protein